MADIEGFSKFFHSWIHQEICNKVIIALPTTHLTCCCSTLWNDCCHKQRLFYIKTIHSTSLVINKCHFMMKFKCKLQRLLPVQNAPFHGHGHEVVNATGRSRRRWHFASDCLMSIQESCAIAKMTHDARYISKSWAVAAIWPFEIIQDGGRDGGGRHLEFIRIENSAIRSVVPENPTL